MPKIAPGSLRRNERLGQESKTGAQAKQGIVQRRDGPDSRRGKGRILEYVTFSATQKLGEKTSKTG